MLKRKVGDAKAAMADFSKAIELSPDCAYAYDQLGNTELSQGDWGLCDATHLRKTSL
jgi:hypothetical protein